MIKIINSFIQPHSFIPIIKNMVIMIQTMRIQFTIRLSLPRCLYPPNPRRINYHRHTMDPLDTNESNSWSSITAYPSKPITARWIISCNGPRTFKCDTQRGRDSERDWERTMTARVLRVYWECRNLEADRVTLNGIIAGRPSMKRAVLGNIDKLFLYHFQRLCVCDWLDIWWFMNSIRVHIS